MSFKILQIKTLFLLGKQHIGVMGIEKANFAANSTLDLPRGKIGVPVTDFKHKINQYICSTCKMIGMVQSRTSFIM